MLDADAAVAVDVNVGAALTGNFAGNEMDMGISRLGLGTFPSANRLAARD